jgi:hypothetical protein
MRAAWGWRLGDRRLGVAALGTDGLRGWGSRGSFNPTPVCVAWPCVRHGVAALGRCGGWWHRPAFDMAGAASLLGLPLSRSSGAGRGTRTDRGERHKGHFPLRFHSAKWRNCTTSAIVVKMYTLCPTDAKNVVATVTMVFQEWLLVMMVKM